MKPNMSQRTGSEQSNLKDWIKILSEEVYCHNDIIEPMLSQSISQFYNTENALSSNDRAILKLVEKAHKNGNLTNIVLTKAE